MGPSKQKRMKQWREVLLNRQILHYILFFLGRCLMTNSSIIASQRCKKEPNFIDSTSADRIRTPPLFHFDFISLYVLSFCVCEQMYSSCRVWRRLKGGKFEWRDGTNLEQERCWQSDRTSAGSRLYTKVLWLPNVKTSGFGNSF